MTSQLTLSKKAWKAGIKKHQRVVLASQILTLKFKSKDSTEFSGTQLREIQE